MRDVFSGHGGPKPHLHQESYSGTVKLQYLCNPAGCKGLRSEPTASRIAGRDPPSASAA